MGEEKNKENKPKISMAEIILVGLLLAMVDFFQALSLLVSPFPVIGQVALGLSTAVGFCVILLVQFYLTMKKVGNPWFLATGATPTRALVWLGMCFVINNPKLEKVAKAASKLAV
jgi:hypothetical protein